MTEAAPDRLDSAKAICRDAGAEALRYFRDLGSLSVERKGHQDLVSEADRNVELLVRDRLTTLFPDDGIVGEEHAPAAGTSGYTWVIDPIDGTANFLTSIPAWAVVLACTHGSDIVIGVIYDPVHDEIYTARAGEGAYLNGKPMQVAQTEGLHDGTIGLGYSNRSKPRTVVRMADEILSRGGLFYRNASGAVSLAFVAAGRLIGYAEDHMNAWDCLAGQLLIQEAGGMIEDQDAQAMLAEGGRVVVGAPAVFEALCEMADRAFADEAAG